MEHAQRDNEYICSYNVVRVLILILMEHAQRDGVPQTFSNKQFVSLNPYFNGTCSKRVEWLFTDS